VVPETGYGNNGNYLWWYDTVNGSVHSYEGLGGVGDLFTEVFGPDSPASMGSTPPPADPYKNRRLAPGATAKSLDTLSPTKRLSDGDQVKLSNHATLLNGIVSTLNAPPAMVSTGCMKPAAPASSLSAQGAGAGARYTACSDMLVAALNCQLTRLVTLGMV